MKRHKHSSNYPGMKNFLFHWIQVQAFCPLPKTLILPGICFFFLLSALSFAATITTYPVPVPTNKCQIVENTTLAQLALKGLVAGTALYATAAPGEYEPISFVIRPDQSLSGITVSCSNLAKASPSYTMPSSNIDIRLVQAWYQSSDGNDTSLPIDQYLIPELLVKDAGLVTNDLNLEKSFLRYTLNGNTYNFDLTEASNTLPAGAIVNDSSTLQSFSLPANYNRQIWMTVKPPLGTPAGVYTGTVTVSSASPAASKTLSIAVTVLPFTLALPLVKQSIYYRGTLSSSGTIGADTKNSAQLQADMANMLEHGIAYPTVYQLISDTSALDSHLAIMTAAGMPKDRIYQSGTTFIGPTDNISVIQTKVGEWRSFAENRGWLDVYFTGKDEAQGVDLTNQIPRWQEVKTAGGKIFATIPNVATAELMMDNISSALLDEVVLYGYIENTASTFNDLHANGYNLCRYGAPFSGFESPQYNQTYYGFKALALGYNIVKDYAFQHNVGIDPWNDYPANGQRPLMFTYPSTNGPIDTVQWEGYREAVDDIRYVSTLASLKGWSKSQAEAYTVSLLAAHPSTGYFPYDLPGARQNVISDILAIPPSLHLKLDETSNVTATDSSGNSYNGTLMDGGVWTTGTINNALQFDGQNDRVHVPDNARLKYQGGNMTFTAWIYPNTTETTEGFIWSKPFNGSGYYNYHIKYNSNQSVTVELMVKNSSTYSLTSTAAVSRGAWHHIAVTLGADKSVKIYVDGTPNNSGNHSITTWTPNSGGDSNLSLTLGFVYPYSSPANVNTSFGFDGKLDDVRLYNRVLDATEINMQHSTPPMACYLKMDEKYGPAAFDYSGNNSYGILMDGPAWFVAEPALKFDGQNDRVHIPDNAKLKYQGGDMTFAAWIYPNTTETTGGYIWSKPFNGVGYYNYSIKYNSNQTITVALMGGNSSNYTLTSTAAVARGAWHHIAVTLGADKSVKIYVDNGTPYSGTHNITAWTPNSGGDSNLPLTLGFVYPYSSPATANTSYGFDGRMNKVRIYNQCLSQSQVSALYSGN